jgi:hypothetical protein
MSWRKLSDAFRNVRKERRVVRRLNRVGRGYAETWILAAAVRRKLRRQTEATTEAGAEAEDGDKVKNRGRELDEVFREQ